MNPPVRIYASTGTGRRAIHSCPGQPPRGLRWRHGPWRRNSYGAVVVHRYYDPSTGQFLSVDPLVAITGTPYAYAGGDPVDESDPDGLGLTFNPLGAIEGLTDFGRGLLGLSQTFGSSSSGSPLHDSYELGNIGFLVLGALSGASSEGTSSPDDQCPAVDTQVGSAVRGGESDAAATVGWCTRITTTDRDSTQSFASRVVSEQMLSTSRLARSWN